MKTTNDALLEAASQGDVKSVRALLSGLNLSKDKKRLDTALGHAAKGGNAKTADLLLKAGADPDSTVVSSSLLIEAAESGDLEMVKLLVDAGADIRRKVTGTDALAAALEMEQDQVANFLKTRGADWAPPMLRRACENGNLTGARQALAAGADVESKCSITSETPLTLAVGNGHLEVAGFLLQHGANPNATVDGKTPLHDAARAGNLDLVRVLIAAWANLRADWEGETVLMSAAASGSLELVKYLVELGADLTARDRHRGMSVVDFAKDTRNMELISYLENHGAKSERAAPRALAKALARKYGGKPVEHVAGFMLNAKFHGTKCQFSVTSDGFSLFVRGLDFAEKEFKCGKNAQLIFSKTKPDFQRQKMEKVAAAGSGSRFLVFRTMGVSILPVPFVVSFCQKHGKLFEQMRLSRQEVVRLGLNFAAFHCPQLDVEQVHPRLEAFARLIQKISRPPQPEQRLFSGEWLLRPAPKSTATIRHQFGGKWEPSVACPHCGSATNVMAQLDLSDPALPKTALGRGRLPVFWCLACLEWDAVFYDLSNSFPKPFKLAGRKTKPGEIKTGEEDLPERAMTLVPVPVGKKAGRKSKLGGSPAWIQMEETPDCPKCEKPMGFSLQLASDSRITYGDMGMLYAFACPECKITASLIQSH